MTTNETEPPDEEGNEREFHVLRRIHRPCHGELLAVDLVDDCPCACLHCRHGRGERTSPSRTSNRAILDRLAFEMDRRRRKGSRPAFVVMGSDSEPFVRSARLQRLAVEALRILLDHRIGVSIETRGVIPDEAIALMASHRHLVRVRVAVGSMDPQFARSWEEGTVDPDTRFFNIGRLKQAGIPVVCHLGPIIPFVNDCDEQFREVLAAAADYHLTRVTTEIMKTWPGINTVLSRHVPGVAPVIAAAYMDHSQLPPLPRNLPPINVRRDIYDRLRAIARRYRLHVGLCRCADNELGTPPCNLGFGTTTRRSRQLGLFAPGQTTKNRSRPSVHPDDAARSRTRRRTRVDK